MALQKPSRIAIRREVGRVGDSEGGLLRHEQMHGQARERTGRHQEELILVPDQRFDRTEQCLVQHMCLAEIEEDRVSSAADSLGEFVDVETAAEGGNFLGELRAAKLDAMPLEVLAGHREHIGCIRTGYPENECFTGPEKLLRLLHPERLRLR